MYIWASPFQPWGSLSLPLRESAEEQVSVILLLICASIASTTPTAIPPALAYLQGLSKHDANKIQMGGWLTLRISDSVEFLGPAHRSIWYRVRLFPFLDKATIVALETQRSAFRCKVSKRLETPEHTRYHRGMSMAKGIVSN